jgi:hypothetical protein
MVEREASAADEMEELAAIIGGDVVAAYGPHSKAFVASRIDSAIHQEQRFAVLRFWAQVADAVEAIDPASYRDRSSPSAAAVALN